MGRATWRERTFDETEMRRMFEGLARFIVRRPAFTIVMVLLVTLLLGMIDARPGLFGLEKDEVEREDAWLPDKEIVRADREINDEFGLQASYLQVIVRADNVLDRQVLIEILVLERDIASNDTVRKVLFPRPGNITSIADVIAAGALGDPTAGYEAKLAALRGLDQATIDAIARGAGRDAAMFLTKDFVENLGRNVIAARGTMILIMLNSSMYNEIDGDYNPILDADLEIVRIIDRQRFEAVGDTGLIESEYVSYKIDRDSGSVMAFLFQMVFVLIIVILLLTYRSVFDTVISLAALVFAITWMNGLGVILGLTFTTMYEAVPIILMGLGIDYGIHLVMRYREERVQHRKTTRKALLVTTVSVGTALFLATLTTAISFGSNMVSEIKPMREFALFALIGITSAFIIMISFVPAVKLLFHRFQEGRAGRMRGGRRRGADPRRRTRATRSRDRRARHAPGVAGGTGVRGGATSVLSRVLAKGAVAAEHHAYTVIVVVLVISLSSTALALQLETEFDFTEFLPENSEITDDILYMTDNFDFGTEKANILVKGDISDPAVLLAMAETERNIRDDPYVNEGDSIESILTLMRDVANGTYGPDPTFTAMYEASNLDGDGVPDANITALFGYLMGNETYMFQTVRVLHYDEESGRFDGAVIRVGVNSHNGAKAKAISEDMEKNIRPLEREPGVTNVVATSGPILMHYIVNSIETSGLQSLLITVVVAGVILTIVFYFTERSIVLGVLTEIPVILVIAWVFASMYISGMNLNVMTIMIASLTVGLGITYGIHVTHRFVEELRRLGDIDEACRSTVVNTGTALFGAAVTTIGGFSILIFAPIPPIRTFGSISALAIFFSLIASVFVLPTFLSLWSKYVQRRDPDRFRRPVHPGRAVRARPAGRRTPEHRAPATRSKDRSRTTGFGRGGPVHPPASAHGVGKRGAAPPGTTSRPDDVDDDGATDDVDRHDGGTAGVSARVDETRETDDISDYAGDDGPDEVTGAGPGRVGDETSDDGGVDGPDDGADDRRVGDVSDDHEMSDGTEDAGPGDRGVPARPGSTDEEFRAE